jgi:NADH-quinone oxidoreductase subunit J
MTANIGINLMTRYLLPFEVVSILLMMALVGAAHLSRKEQQV